MSHQPLLASKQGPWRLKDSSKCVETGTVFYGTDPTGMELQVATANWTCANPPSRDHLRRLHKERQGKHFFPLVVMLTMNETAFLLGTDGDGPLHTLPLEQAHRILQSALDEPTGLAASNRLTGLQRASAHGTSGMTNRGLFADHYLSTSGPERADWDQAEHDAQDLLGLTHQSLIQALGYGTSRTSGQALLLTSEEAPRAVAVLLEASEQFDASTPRFSLSPVAWGLQVAAKHEVPWLMVLRGSQLRLYPAKPGVGVGQKGQADTFFELDLAVLDSQHAAYLPLVFSAQALAPGGSTEQILDASTQFAVELGERLRERVYDHAVPQLARAVAGKLTALGHTVDADGLALAYGLSLKILFRLLFQAYAEDRGLLPYGRNERYDRNALKTWAKDLAEDPDQPFDEDSSSIWDDLTQVWRVIDTGDSAWDVPAYNGGLFGSDPSLNPEGALLAKLRLSNATVGPVLAALLVDKFGDSSVGPVDFRSLSVREFGTIYEGLLESSLSIAPIDLTLDKEGTYIPATGEQEVVVSAGDVYFHSASGQRKSTGSYYTKHILVEHLISRSLEPALNQHLDEVAELLEVGNEAQAAEKFFDFRVADIAMGSGHFLTAAIDHVEAGMRDFLTEHPIPAVTDELRRLENSANKALGKDADAADIEPAALLRRQIARRCIYGLDLNPIAVELARLSIWITTFVPGLPMSSLDHNLVCANSLTGIATIEESINGLDPSRQDGASSLFFAAIEDELQKARELLINAANTSEATKAEVAQAAEAAQQARQAATPARLIFDSVVAGRLGLLNPSMYLDPQELQDAAAKDTIAKSVQALQPAHFPYLFPEVFLRDNPGFDVLIGNPPWDEVKVDEPRFWVRARPGLMALSPQEKTREVKRLRKERPDLMPELENEIQQTDAMRAVLLAGNFPGLGTGDTDLYRAFAWRNWHLVRENGYLGLVFPRSLLNAAGNAKWREEVLARGQLDVVTLMNDRNWVFPEVDVRYSFALVNASRRGDPHTSASMAGPFRSEVDFLAGKDSAGHIPVPLLMTAAAGASFPQLPDSVSADLFAQIRKAPRLDERSADWDFRPVREFDATNDRKTFDAGDRSSDLWPVYGGSSFNFWTPETGEYYAWADPEAASRKLSEKLKRQMRIRSSAFHGLAFDSPVLDPRPFERPRLAFRAISRSTDTRTIISALIPGNRFIVNSAPYLLRRAGDARTEAYLLGVLSSIPLDWYARRYVEMNVNLHIVNGLPVPQPSDDNKLRVRVVEVSGRLAAADDRYSTWASEVGVTVGSVQSTEVKDDLVAELDALVALLYGLDRNQLEHVFATFHRGWDYQPRLNSVLGHYDAWASASQ